MKTKKSKLLSAVLAAVMIASVGSVVVNAGSGSAEYHLRPDVVETDKVPVAELTWEENSDGTITVTGMKGLGVDGYGVNCNMTEFLPDLIIPEQIDGKKVTAIGDMAFTMASFNSISFPSSIKKIGKGSFMFCGMLGDELVLPENVEYIDNSAFNSFELYSDVTRNEFGKELEDGSINVGRPHIIESINVPKSVKFIGWYAFGTQMGNPVDEIIMRQSEFKIYGGGYVEKYFENFGAVEEEGKKWKYNYKIVGQVDPEPSQKEKVNGLKVSGAIPQGAEFKAEATTTKWLKDPLFCYNISLNKDGKEVQPDGYVTISIPCEYSNGYVVYINEETGEMENLESIYSNGYYVFVTDHLSDYAIQFYGDPIKYDGPVDEDSEESSETGENSESSQNSQTGQNSTNNTTNNNTNNNTTTNTPVNTTVTAATTTTETDTSVPKTGDASASAVVFSVMLAASAAAIIFAKRRKSN